MTRASHPREDFLLAMRDLRSDFQAAKSDVRRREDALHRALGEVRRALETSPPAGALSPDHPLNELIRASRSSFAARVAAWVRTVDVHDRGTRFREGFTDTLLVFVLGKVKAGKSAMGNYIAYGATDPTPAQRAAAPVNFFISAHADPAMGRAAAAEIASEHFKVGATETTSTIQGFRVEGLTWVDSPGLHSVTKENGALASDYAGCADVIVYPMPSGSPGRDSDIKEVKNLIENGKTFLVLVTRSDEVAEDEDEEGRIVSRRVMKSDSDRATQISYVRTAVANAGRQVEVIPVSFRYAEEHADDPDALADSGITALFGLLTRVAREDGVRVKRDTPSRNLNAFVDRVCGRATGGEGGELSAELVKAELFQLRDKVKQLDDDLDEAAEVAIQRAKSEIVPEIGKIVNSFMVLVSSPILALGSARLLDEQLRRDLIELIERVVTNIAEEKLNHFATELQGAVQSSIKIDLSDLAEFKENWGSLISSNRGARKVIGRGSGALAGAGIGFAVGGPLGAFVGGMVGDQIGSWLGAASGREETTRFFLGHNTEEVIASAQGVAAKAAEDSLLRVRDDLRTGVVKPIMQETDRLIFAIGRFQQTLLKDVHQ